MQPLSGSYIGVSKTLEDYSLHSNLFLSYFKLLDLAPECFGLNSSIDIKDFLKIGGMGKFYAVLTASCKIK